MDPPNRYKEVFEKCPSHKDGAVTPNDFASIVCRTFKLNYHEVVNQISTDGHGMFSIRSFMMYMQKQYEGAQRSNGIIGDHTHGYYNHDIAFNSPPPRPPSGSKMVRQGVPHYPSNFSNPSHNRRPHPISSPTTVPSMIKEPSVAFNDEEDRTPEELNGGMKRPPIRTPEHNMSPEDHRHTTASRTDHDRLHGHAPPYSTHLHASHPTSSHAYNNVRMRPGTYSRGAVDSPPPIRSHPHYQSGRSHHRERGSKFEKTFNDSGDEDVVGGGGAGGMDPYHPAPQLHAPSLLSRTSNKKCKNCDKQKELHLKQVKELQEDLKRYRQERVRLEDANEQLRLHKSIHDSHSSDGEQIVLRKEIDSLLQENARLRSDIESKDFYDRQYEDMKKAKKNLKMEYNNLKVKYEDIQKKNWSLNDDNRKLHMKLMKEDEQSPLFRRPGDGGSEENCSRPVLGGGGESNFKRTSLRSTLHGTRNEICRDSGGRGKNAMKRISSAGNPLDHDEPVKETSRHDPYKYSSKTTKTFKSAGTSDVGSTGDNFNFPLATSIPDDQSQVFMVLNEDVSKSVLPKGLPKEQELAMMYALQNCHSIQELIKYLLSHGLSTPSDKLNGFQVENEHLKHHEEHLLAKLNTMTLSFENAKADMTAMYHKANICEANNTRLRHALKLCQQACEVYEVLLECKNVDPRFCNGSISSPYYTSASYDSLDPSTRSPDREGLLLHRTSLPARVRMLLNQLEANPELQNYLPYDKHSMLSQNTGTTSGLSSLSGGTDVDITPSDVDRLRQYTQALMHYEKHLVVTMESLDGLNGLSTVKKPEELADSLLGSDRCREVNEMEEAAHAEELCKVREEKAELKSQIYMMEQEKKRMELEVGCLKLQKIKSDKLVTELKFHYSEERRKRKRERKQRMKGDSAIPSHESGHVMSEFSLEFTSALEREKELTLRYEELFSFLQTNIKDSQDTTDELMRFVKELRRANSALVDAFEKSKKRQQADKRRLKLELVTYMNRVQGTGGGEEPVNGAQHFQ